jgi:hypothetical protein
MSYKAIDGYVRDLAENGAGAAIGAARGDR